MRCVLILNVVFRRGAEVSIGAGLRFIRRLGDHMSRYAVLVYYVLGRVVGWVESDHIGWWDIFVPPSCESHTTHISRESHQHWQVSETQNQNRSNGVTLNIAPICCFVSIIRHFRNQVLGS